MKTTVPNKSVSTTTTAVSGSSTKEQTKMKLEKELEDINKKLVNSSKGKKGPECELNLLERKVYVMMKLRQWKDVLEEGYKVLGKKGPDVIIYKCILVSLCRLGKFEDDVVELLNHWKNATPKCSQMSDTRRKMEGYLSAIRSGMNASLLLQNIEEVLGLQSDLIFAINNSSTESEPSWRFRPPPQRHNTFSICPRIVTGSCIYSDDCLLAHSKEELKEWQFRSQWNSKKGLPDCSLDSLRLLKSPQSSNMSLSVMVKEHIPQTYRLLPPACMYYLLGLVKKVKEADNIKKVLTENLPDVKIKFTSSLELTKVLGNSFPVTHKWSFMIASRQPLATVTLLHDVNREHFGITGAFFFNSKKQSMDLIDMHPNNKNQKFIQVLNTFIRPDVFLPFNNGWPEWCCYQVDVLFQTKETIPAVYEQNIVFDFKNDPKVAKRLSVKLESPKPQEFNQQAIVPKPYYITSSSNCDISSDTDENNSIDEELEPVVSEGNIVKRNFAQDPWGQQRSNEATALELETSSSSSTTILKPNFDLETDLSSQQQLDRSRSDSESENSLNMSSNIDENDPKMANYISLIRKQAIEDFQLVSCSKRQLDIWMSLDTKYLAIVLDIIKDGLMEHHYKLLFPELPESKPWALSSLMDEFEHPKKLDQKLNGRQKKAFCAIINQPVCSSNNSTMSPVVITGPTGSGKTYTLAHSILAVTAPKVAQEQTNRVLICTYSNEAADKYVAEYFNPSSKIFKTMGSIPTPLRIYYAEHSVQSVSDVIREHCLLTADKASFRYPTIEEIFSHSIIIVTLATCLELVQLGLPDDTFSYIFIDEATQMLEIETLCPIVLAGINTKLVLAGDLSLLGPEIFSLELSSKMTHLSMVDRLNNLYPSNNPSRIKLQETYTIQKEIIQFVSSEFYSSSLISAQSQPSAYRYYPLCFSAVIGGDDSIADTGEGYFNMKEVLEIRDRILDLIAAWPPNWESPKDHSIVVLTSYPAQATGLRIRLKLDGLSFVDVETLQNTLAKQYQVVMISPVRTFKDYNPDNLVQIKETETECGFYTNRKSIYTAFTRAESLVIVVGDLVSLCNVGPCRDIWREYVSICRRHNSLMGLKSLSGYKPDNTIGNTPATNSQQFETLTYNIPPVAPKNEYRAPESDIITKPQAPRNYAEIKPNAENLAPSLNSINLNYETSSSQQHKKCENIVAKRDLTPINGNLSSIWDPIEENYPGNTSINSSNSCSSIWDNYPSTTTLSKLDLKSIWNTDNKEPYQETQTRKPGYFNSEIQESSYRSPFDLPDVRLMEKFTSNETRIAPGSLAVLPNKMILNQRVENCSNGSSMKTHHPFLGGVPISVDSGNSNTPVAVMRPIGTPIPQPTPPAAVTRIVGNKYFNNFDASNHDPFHPTTRRHAYVPPPRMLRTLNAVPQSAIFENFNSGYKKEPCEPSKDFDFFTELGLVEDHINHERKNAQSSSSSSSSQASGELLASDPNFVLNSIEFPQLSQPSGWVQVKSSKKSKSPPEKQQNQTKKSKKKSKGVSETQPKKELTVEQKIHSLMEMGFEKRYAIRALQNSEKDLQRSVEWLIMYAPVKKAAE